MRKFYFTVPLTKEIIDEMYSIYLQWFEGTGND